MGNLAHNLSKIHTPVDHPWYGSQLTAIYYQDKTNLKKLMELIVENYSTMQNHLEKLKKCLFFNNPITITKIETLIDINLLLNKYYRYIKNPFLRLTISFWKNHSLLKKHISNAQHGKQVELAFDKLKNQKRIRQEEKINIESYEPTIYALLKLLGKLGGSVCWF